MNALTTVELWKIMEDKFFRPRIVTYDMYMLLIIKQSKGALHLTFFWQIKGTVRKLRTWVSRKYSYQRFFFIANMQDPEIQRELQREIFEPAQSLRLGNNI